MFKRDIFGHPLLFKRLLIIIVGYIYHHRFTRVNKMEISGSEHMQDLPDEQVLIVSNHQTYFADVTAIVQVFSAVKNGQINSLDKPGFLWRPRLRFYFVAALETMTTGILPRIFRLAGAITIKRTWRAAGKEVQRKVDPEDSEKIGHALKDGWVITFPQGSTKPFLKGRKGTAHLIKQHQPIVIPVVIDGFRRAFEKKGLHMKKRGVTLKLRVKPPLDIDYHSSPEAILEQVMNGIEQQPQPEPVNVMG